LFLSLVKKRIEEEEDLAEARKDQKLNGETGAVAIPKSGVQKKGAELRLQRNLLAKIIVDEKEVSKKLVVKRKEFEDRINKCKTKQQQLLAKQDNVIS
jgi:hypothetical protein